MCCFIALHPAFYALLKLYRILVYDLIFSKIIDYTLSLLLLDIPYLYNINYLRGFQTFPAAAWHWCISWSSWLSWARLPNFWATTAPAPVLSHPPFLQHHCDSIQEIHSHSWSASVAGCWWCFDVVAAAVVVLAIFSVLVACSLILSWLLRIVVISELALFEVSSGCFFGGALNFQEKYQSLLCRGLVSIVLFNFDQPCCVWVAASVHLDERYSFPSGKSCIEGITDAFAQETTLQQCCICKCAIHWRLFVLDCWCVCDSMSFPHG